MENNYRKYRIFRRDIQKKDGGTWAKYTTKLGYKPQDSDEWDNEFFDVEFRIKGGVDIQHGTDILVPAGGDSPAFTLREANLPEALISLFRDLWRQDEKKTRYLLSDLGLKMEKGKFYRIVPTIAIYQYEMEGGGHNQQSHDVPSGWGSSVPDGWGSASPKEEDITDSFCAAEDDIPF